MVVANTLSVLTSPRKYSYISLYYLLCINTLLIVQSIFYEQEISSFPYQQKLLLVHSEIMKTPIWQLLIQ